MTVKRSIVVHFAIREIGPQNQLPHVTREDFIAVPGMVPAAESCCFGRARARTHVTLV